MNLEDIKDKVPSVLYDVLKGRIVDLRPAQEKAVNAGLLDGKNLLVCTPTASGKTLIAELASVKRILDRKGKAVYIVPLKALASEKYRDFKDRYDKVCGIALSVGDIDKNDSYLGQHDLIITTSEKLDSLIRHHAAWIGQISTVIIDEIHLLNDPERGPTLEILITMLRMLVNAQIIGLSATIGNPEELAAWLGAELVIDDWRPVELKKGIYLDGEVTFY
jgi:helicase